MLVLLNIFSLIIEITAAKTSGVVDLIGREMEIIYIVVSSNSSNIENCWKLSKGTSGKESAHARV